MTEQRAICPVHLTADTECGPSCAEQRRAFAEASRDLELLFRSYRPPAGSGADDTTEKGVPSRVVERLAPSAPAAVSETASAPDPANEPQDEPEPADARQPSYQAERRPLRKRNQFIEWPRSAKQQQITLVGEPAVPSGHGTAWPCQHMTTAFSGRCVRCCVAKPAHTVLRHATGCSPAAWVSLCDGCLDALAQLGLVNAPRRLHVLPSGQVVARDTGSGQFRSVVA